MRKSWKWIIVAIALLLIGIFAWFLIDYFSVPRLPPWEKNKVEHIYIDEWCWGSEVWYEHHPIVWYDENNCVEEENVWRYVGNYGKCYAFLLIGDGRNGLGQAISLPCIIEGLTRDVFYSKDARIILYSTVGKLPTRLGYEEGSKMQLQALRQISNREEWITDEQLEQLTRDIEKLAKAHN